MIGLSILVWFAILSLSIISIPVATNFSKGVWYPLGGVYQIAMALDSLAEELGVR